MILTDVVPSKVYLYDLALVKVLCTDTQGWLRGWVDLHHTGNSPHIQLHDIERNCTFSIPVYSHNDKITVNTLKELSPSTIQKKLTKIDNQIEKCRQETIKLKAMRCIIGGLQYITPKGEN